MVDISEDQRKSNEGSASEKEDWGMHVCWGTYSVNLSFITISDRGQNINHSLIA